MFSTIYPFACLTGLKLLHELTARKVQGNFLRFDMDSANGTHGVDVFVAFSVGPSPGYQLHIGNRSSSHNMIGMPTSYKSTCISIKIFTEIKHMYIVRVWLLNVRENGIYSQ